MSDISLTASMRSNLLSLQQTQDLMDQTQERLSTGKKVNSAIDNPSSYYTAQSLTNRASDLSSLLDSMGQGIQTIQAANEAIESITTFAEQLKSIANSARDISNNMKTKVSTTREPEGTVGAGGGKVLIDSREDMDELDLVLKAGTANTAFNATFVVDGKSYDISLPAKGTSQAYSADELKAAIEKGLSGAGVTFSGTGNNLKITSESGKAISYYQSTAEGFDTGSDAAAKAVTITAGDDVSKIMTAINNDTTNNKHVTASIDESGKLVITAKGDNVTDSAAASGHQIQVFGDAAVNEVLGSSFGGTIDTIVTDEEAISERNKYIEQYNEVLEQIDALAKDASYKGINLLQENDLKVIFNEDRSSSIEIKGVDASSKGLGLETIEKGGWNIDTAIDDAITQVEGAISELRSMASDFGNNYSIVQTREDFTENLINVLEEGADKLTLADMNEEGANMLALQTRQQLAVNSLSLASQASQAVLQLF